MRFFKRIWNRIRTAVQGRFEAVYQRWGDKSLLWQTLQDARQEVDVYAREELCRRHDYWLCNSALVQRIRSLVLQFSVGIQGLQCNPDSSDDVWNDLYANNYLLWCKAPEIGSRLQMWELHIQWAGMLFDKGEIFILKTQDAKKRPMIQTIDTHRIKTPPELKEQEGKTIVDGIELTKLMVNGRMVMTGKPAAYWVRDEFDKDIYTKIPADQIIHKFKARRPGQMRGIPEGFSGFNTLHDYEDLHQLEMQVAKQAALVGNVETNATGELDTQGSRRARFSVQGQDASGNPITKTDGQFYKVTLGAQTIGLRAGDSLKQFQVDRPSIVTQEYWDLLAGIICAAYNVPKLLVFPFSLQGTVTRADLDICTNAFRANFEIVACAVEEIYQWRTAWTVQMDRSMDGTPPADYLACHIEPPRAPNVDIGYTAANLVMELEAGTKNYAQVLA